MISHPRWGTSAERRTEGEKVSRGEVKGCKNFAHFIKYSVPRGLFYDRFPICHCFGVNPDYLKNGGGKEGVE